MNNRPRPYREDYLVPEDYPLLRIKLRRPGKPIWHSIKDFINGLKINTKFTRKDITKDIYRGKVPEITVVDNYNKLLTKIGVLEKIDDEKYIKRKRIPKSLTTTQLIRYSNSSNWESWFISLEMIE